MADVNIGVLAATTLRNRKTAFADNATNHIALLNRLNEKGKIRKNEDGRKITCPLVFDGNGTYTRYSGFQVLDINDGEVIDAAEYDPVQSSVNYTISGREMAMNRGKSQAVRLVKGRMEGAMADMRNNINSDLLSDGTASEQIGGLQHLIADDPTTSTNVGGINQSTYSWWRNQTYDFSANSKTAAANMLEGMNSLYISCTFGTSAPDLVLMDETYFAIYENALQDNQRYTNSKMAEAGFVSLKYKGADVVFEKTASGMPSSHAYFINTDHMELCTYKGRHMEASVPDGLQPINQDGLVFPILFMGNLVVDSRRVHGVLKD